MKLYRGRNTAIIDYLKPHLLQSEDEPLDETIESLRHFLTQDPEGIFILCAFDEEESDSPELVAFLIGNAPVDRSYAWLWQAWKKNDDKFNQLASNMFKRFLAWVDLQDRKVIRMETQRSPATFTRAWNFKPYSTVMEYSLSEEFGIPLTKDLENVVTSPNESSEHTLEESEKGSSRTGEGHTRGTSGGT